MSIQSDFPMPPSLRKIHYTVFDACQLESSFGRVPRSCQGPLWENTHLFVTTTLQSLKML